MNEKIAIIVNSKSGNQTENKDVLIRSAFKGHLRAIKIYKVKGSDLSQVVQNLKKVHKVIVAAGGDGTVSTVASTLYNSKNIFGVLPLGTINNFARTIKMPLDLNEAARVILQGKKMKIDIGEVNGRYFINNSSIGVYTNLLKRREYFRKKGVNKFMAVFLASFSIFQAFRNYEVKLKVKGGEIRRETPLVFIGNNDYKLDKKFDLGTREKLDGNTLSVYFTKKISQMGFLKLIFSNLWGTIYQEEKFDHLLTSDLIIESKKTKLTVACDGESELMEPPLRYRIHHQALNVIIP